MPHFVDSLHNPLNIIFGPASGLSSHWSWHYYCWLSKNMLSDRIHINSLIDSFVCYYFVYDLSKLQQDRFNGGPHKFFIEMPLVPGYRFVFGVIGICFVSKLESGWQSWHWAAFTVSPLGLLDSRMAFIEGKSIWYCFEWMNSGPMYSQRAFYEFQLVKPVPFPSKHPSTQRSVAMRTSLNAFESNLISNFENIKKAHSLIAIFPHFFFFFCSMRK